MKGIEEQIRRAMDEGKFEDLPGKGHPLDLGENPYEDPEWSTAYRMLRSSGFTLPWIESRQEIGGAVAGARDSLSRAWEWCEIARSEGESPTLIDQEWERARQSFRGQVEQINKKISSYNLEAPSDQFQLPLLNFEKEVGEVIAGE